MVLGIQEGSGGATGTGSEMAALQQITQQGLADGQTWFAATGGTGSDDCDDRGQGFGCRGVLSAATGCGCQAQPNGGASFMVLGLLGLALARRRAG